MEGLLYIPNFISNDEANTILDCLNKESNWKSVGSSKHSRRVLHYGYSYSYTTTYITKTNPIPDLYQFILERIKIKNLEQLIINEYLPGQGIAPHIDSSSFGPEIACLTLNSGIQIDFIRPNYDKYSIYVEPNSLYIMSGESRTHWKHGIAPRKKDGNVIRDTRYSLTFRSINKTNM